MHLIATTAVKGLALGAGVTGLIIPVVGAVMLIGWAGGKIFDGK